jgi:shikimate kinase
LYEKRAPIYAQADLSIEARPEYAIEDMTSKVVDALMTRPDVLEKTT